MENLGLNLEDFEGSGIEKGFIGDISKGKKVPVGTVTNGYKKMGEGKWVPVKKDKKSKSSPVVKEGKYQKTWQTQKYVKAGNIELVGDKHSSPSKQVYKINKDKEQVGSFSYDKDSGSYNLLDGTKQSFQNIDELVKFSKENLTSTNPNQEEDTYFSDGADRQPIRKVQVGKFLLDGSKSDIKVGVYDGENQVGEVYFDEDDNGFWTSGSGSNILLKKEGGQTWYPSIQKIVDTLKDNQGSSNTGKDVAERMKSSKWGGQSTFPTSVIEKVSKMDNVTREDLEKVVPDYIAGSELTKVLK